MDIGLNSAKPSGVRVLGVDHIALAVRDLEAAIRFYEDLGFQVVDRRVTHGERTAMRSAVLRHADVTFVLLQGTSPESQVDRFLAAHGPGVHHVALRVERVHEAMSGLEERGVLADTEVITNAGLAQVFLQRTDASGVRVELIERGTEAFPDASVERLFRTFEERNLY